MATTALHVGHSATRPCKEAMDEPIPALRAYSRFFPSIRIDRDGSELAWLPGRGRCSRCGPRSEGRFRLREPRDVDLPDEIAPFRGHRCARFVAAVPVLDLVHLDVATRDRDHEGVSHVRRGLGGDLVLEDRRVRRLGHPPEDQIVRLPARYPGAFRFHLGLGSFRRGPSSKESTRWTDKGLFGRISELILGRSQSSNQAPQEQRTASEATWTPHRGHAYTYSLAPPEGSNPRPQTGQASMSDGTRDAHSGHENVTADIGANPTPQTHSVDCSDTNRPHDGH